MSTPRDPLAHITRDRYGRWAIVVGASDGIGAAFSRRLAERGIDLVLIARRKAPLVALADELRNEHRVATRVLNLDFSAVGAEQALLETTLDLDVGMLVYNAGGDDMSAATPNGTSATPPAPTSPSSRPTRNCAPRTAATASSRSKKPSNSSAVACRPGCTPSSVGCHPRWHGLTSNEWSTTSYQPCSGPGPTFERGERHGR
jgi:short chain dehydrogenase